jgi:hypothetical protein
MSNGVYQVAERGRPPGPRKFDLGVWPALLLPALAFLAILSLEVFAIDPSRPMAVVFAPGISADDALHIVVAAGGLPVRRERSVLTGQLIWVAAAEDPGFMNRVRRLGAWLVVNPYAFGGCLLKKAAP